MSILTHFKETCSESLVPMQATLELTYKCNERCSHCYLASYVDEKDGRKPFTLPEWKNALDQLADAGSLLLVLIGGEAMMHPHFWEISEYAAQKNFALSLITNGLLMDDKAADRIADLGFFNVTVSLYSTFPETHDRMTNRKGSHFRTMSAIERLLMRNVMVGINCLLTNQNIDSCFSLEEWALKKGIQIRFDPLVTAKSDGSLGSLVTRASNDQLLNFYREQKMRGRSPTPTEAGLEDDPVCNAGRGKCAIDVYGNLLTCLEVRDELGSLRDHSFTTLWNSEKANQLRGLKNKELQFEYSCGDGLFCDHCPGMSHTETGDARKPVPFLMEVAQIKRRVFEENL